MQSINSLSIAPDARDWLANSRHPRILHIFDQACNLVNEHREVLSVVTTQIGNGPFNLVVEDSVIFSDHLNLQSPISISSTHITLGNRAINTGDTKLWPPRPDWELLHARRDDVLSHIMSLRGAQLATKQSPRSGGDCFGWTNTALAMTLSQLPITTYQFSNSLISAVASADLPSCLTAAKQLAGLGTGLTPSGDDFILGAVLAALIIHPPEIASVLTREITNIAAPLTTSLSAAWLRSAGKGEAGILWHEFFESLSVGNTSDIQLQITKLLSVGETSGADALSGFFGVISSFKTHIIDECPS